MALKILVADDHPAIFMAVRGVLLQRPGWEVCGEIGSADAMMRALKAGTPDIVITDYHMPADRDCDGMHMLGNIRRRFPSLKIIVLTMITNPLILRAIMDTPVQGLLLKSETLAELVYAIQQVDLGQTYVSPTASLLINDAVSERAYPDQRPGVQSLSVRETEVLRLYLAGRSVTQIADALSRSVKTISRQKNCAMQKLGANNDRELFDFAAQQDIVLPNTSG
jgi:two-component system capsular synthesis response regulator RcsB